MASNTLSKSVEPATALRKMRADCAYAVARAIAVVAGFVVTVGWLIENRSVVGNVLAALGRGIYLTWDMLILTVSLGGYFWGAIVVGVAALSVGAWCSCMCYKADDLNIESQLLKQFQWGLALAILVWVLSLIAMFSTYSELSELSSYQCAALIAIWAPCALAFFIVPAIAMQILTET
jgi:hypothetical protein